MGAATGKAGSRGAATGGGSDETAQAEQDETAQAEQDETPRTGAAPWSHGRVLRRPLAMVLSAVAAAAGALVATPAEATPATVVLTLRASSPAALQQAAARPPQDAADRTERARLLAPTARRGVERWLTDHGFTVESATTWTVTARGPAHLLTRRLPPALRPSVLSVVRDAAGTMRPRTVPVGYAPEDLRAAYASAGRRQRHHGRDHPVLGLAAERRAGVRPRRRDPAVARPDHDGARRRRPYRALRRRGRRPRGGARRAGRARCRTRRAAAGLRRPEHHQRGHRRVRRGRERGRALHLDGRQHLLGRLRAGDGAAARAGPRAEPGAHGRRRGDGLRRLGGRRARTAAPPSRRRTRGSRSTTRPRARRCSRSAGRPCSATAPAGRRPPGPTGAPPAPATPAAGPAAACRRCSRARCGRQAAGGVRCPDLAAVADASHRLRRVRPGRQRPAQLADGRRDERVRSAAGRSAGQRRQRSRPQPRVRPGARAAVRRGPRRRRPARRGGGRRPAPPGRPGLRPRDRPRQPAVVGTRAAPGRPRAHGTRCHHRRRGGRRAVRPGLPHGPLRTGRDRRGCLRRGGRARRRPR